MIGSNEDLFAMFEQWAVEAPAQLALASRAGHMNYEDLVGNIASATVAATAAGIGPGQLVVVGVDNADMALILALALMRIGCRVGYTRDLELYENSGVAVDAVIADAKAPPSKYRTVNVGPQWFAGAKARGLRLPPPMLSFSVIVSSSGSTGRPKLIEKTHTVAIRGLKNTSRLFPLSQPRVLALFGGRTSLNFYDRLSALAAGGTVIRSADRSAAGVIDTMQLFRPHFMAMVPSFLHEIVQRLETNPTLFPKVETVRTSGAYCSPQLQRDALERICDDMVMTYGSVETGFLAWGHSREIQKVERSVGKLFDDVEVAAFDSSGQQLPIGSEGEIRARVPDVGAGTYLGEKPEQSNAFKDGWFSTGDVGMVDENRNLIIRGRASNVINIGGSKVSPEELEDHILTMANIVEVGVTGVDVPEGYQKVCAAIVSTNNPPVEAINAHLARRKEPWPVHAAKYVAAIPRTDNGKVDRVALKRLCSE